LILVLQFITLNIVGMAILVHKMWKSKKIVPPSSCREYAPYSVWCQEARFSKHKAHHWAMAFRPSTPFGVTGQGNPNDGFSIPDRFCHTSQFLPRGLGI
jgi:hypothetical protein